MSERIVILSDVQAPLEDRRAVKGFINFVGEYQPDRLVCIGDLADYPQPSRWTKGTQAEFEGSVFEDSEYIKTKILDPIRAVYDGPFGFIEGNHDARPRDYLVKYAPALASSRAFHPDVLLDFDRFGIETLPEFHEFAPGWLMTHGHRGGIRLTQKAGQTALGAAQKFGRSVIMGHTHRMGLMHHTYGYDAKISKTLWGFEVGTMMSQRLAQYLKGGTANWQLGFGVVTVDGRSVTPQLVPINNNKFSVDGNAFTI